MMQNQKVQRYQAKASEYEEPDFEENVRFLGHLYHSYVQTHAGYLIGIIIGSLTLISRWDIFFGNIWSIIIFILLMGGIAFAFVWASLRATYWAWLASQTIAMTKEDVIELFTDFNNSEQNDNPYYSKPPYPAIIETAVLETLAKLVKDKKTSIVKKLAVATARRKKRK